MANILTVPESGIFFDGNTAGNATVPVLTGNASGVAIKYNGFAGLEISSSASGINYLDRFSVDGANGRLFSVTDEVTGIIFSVNDAAGLPIIEVESISGYDKITIGEFGTNALVVSGSGVGIANSTPLATLHVAGDTILSGNLDISGSITPAKDVAFDIGSPTKRFKDLYLSGDSIFLGDTKLSISGDELQTRKNGVVKRFIKNTDTGNFAPLTLVNAKPNATNPDFTGDNTFFRGNSRFFKTVAINGNVGIGTTTPGVELDIKGNASDEIFFRYNTVDNRPMTIKAPTTGSTNTPFVFQTFNSFQFRMDNDDSKSIHLDHNGNVGLGTLSPHTEIPFLEKAFIVKAGDSSSTTLQQAGIVIAGSSDSDDADDFGTLAFVNNHSTLTYNRVAQIFVQKVGTDVNTSDMVFRTADGSTESEVMRLKHNGRVGIGTDSPSETLGVKGNIRLENDAQRNIIGPLNESLGIFANPNGADEGILFSTDHGTTTEMIILNGGNVGIGTTSPVQDLELNKNNANVNLNIRSSNAGNATLLFGDQSDVSAGSVTYANSSDSMLFKVNNQQEKMRITSAGKVGIGTDSPSHTLDILGDGFAGFRIEEGATNKSFLFQFHQTQGRLNLTTDGDAPINLRASNHDTNLLINTNGNVGIGTTVPAAKLHVSGDTIVSGGLTTLGKTTLSSDAFVTETGNFTLGATHKGATVFLQNPSSITITAPAQTAGYVTTFIAETINTVSFATGVGMSGLNSFNGASDIAGIFGQAQIIYKSSSGAFLGGNIV